MRTKLQLPRAYSLCIVSSLFIISQLFAIGVSSVGALWMASVSLGLAYGSLYGAVPAILIEWFGLGGCALPYTPRCTNKHSRSSCNRELWIPLHSAHLWRQPLLDHVRA